MTAARARLLLVLAAAAWGLGNVPQKTVLTHLEPLTAIGLRGLLGVVLLLPLTLRAPVFLSIGADPVRLAGVAGLFALAMGLQQVAYLDTSVATGSVLVNAGVVLTPLLVWLMRGERPTRAFALAAIAATLGLALMSGRGDVLGWPGRGDALALAAAAAYAVWAIMLAQHLRTGGSALLATLAQFAVAAALALPLGLWLAWPTGAALRAAGPDLLLLALFPTAFAFGIQAVALRSVSPSHAALILSLEGVFGMVGGMALLGERPGAHGLGGAAVLLAAIVAVSWPARVAEPPR